MYASQQWYGGMRASRMIDTLSLGCCWQYDKVALLIRSVVKIGSVSAYFYHILTRGEEKASRLESVSLTTVAARVMLSGLA